MISIMLGLMVYVLALLNLTFILNGSGSLMPWIAMVVCFVSGTVCIVLGIWTATMDWRCERRLGRLMSGGGGRRVIKGFRVVKEKQ